MSEQGRIPGEVEACAPLPLPPSPFEPVDLPEPAPELVPRPVDQELEREKAYFHPERWDAETHALVEADDRDPVAYGLGMLEGQGRAALFLADLHMADGSAGGDDFLETHILPDATFNGLYTGFFPPGESRAEL